MPNWCKGVLKVRGAKENIVNFLQNGLQSVNFLGDNTGKHTVEIDEDEIEIKDVKGSIYIKNTHRNFIENTREYSSIYLSLRKYSDHTFVCAINGFKAAWGIDTNDLAKISKEYGIDFKIYAFEMGMEFNLDIEIVAGEIIKDEEIKFDNYDWDCINPFIGG